MMLFIGDGNFRTLRVPWRGTYRTELEFVKILQSLSNSADVRHCTDIAKWLKQAFETKSVTASGRVLAFESGESILNLARQAY